MTITRTTEIPVKDLEAKYKGKQVKIIKGHAQAGVIAVCNGCVPAAGVGNGLICRNIVNDSRFMVFDTKHLQIIG